MPCAGQTNPFSDPLLEKNRVRHKMNINFTRVVVTLALLWHQTSHSQDKFFLTSCTIYYFYVEYDFFLLGGSKNGFFLRAGHKVDFIAPCGENKSIF